MHNAMRLNYGVVLPPPTTCIQKRHLPMSQKDSLYCGNLMINDGLQSLFGKTVKCSLLSFSFNSLPEGRAHSVCFFFFFSVGLLSCCICMVLGLTMLVAPEKSSLLYQREQLPCHRHLFGGIAEAPVFHRRTLHQTEFRPKKIVTFFRANFNLHLVL